MVPIHRSKEVVRRFLEEVVNAGRFEVLPELVSPDCVETDGRVRVTSGLQGMADHVRAVREIYEGLTITIERQLAEGEWVATLVTARGTHAREWLGMAPTGRELVFTGVNLDRVVDGRIVEHGGAADMLMPFFENGSLRPA